MKKSAMAILVSLMILSSMLASAYYVEIAKSGSGDPIDVSPAIRITNTGDSSGDGYYERDPQLLIASSGTWHLAFLKSQTTFTHGSSPDDLKYDAYVKTSSDSGVTWAAETKVLDAAAIDWYSSFRGLTICEADGKIWVIGANVKNLEGDIYANKYSGGTWSGQSMIFDGTYSTGAFHLDSIVEGNDIRLFYGIQQESEGVGFIKYHSSTQTWDNAVTKIGASAGYQIPRVIKVGSTYYIVSSNWEHILFTKTTTPDVVPWPSATYVFDAPSGGAACDPTILKYGNSDGTDDLIVFSSPAYSDNSQPVEYVYSTDAGTTWTLSIPFTDAAHGAQMSWDMMSRAYLKNASTIMLFYGMEQRGVDRGQGDIVVCYWSILSTIGNEHYTTIQDSIEAASAGDTILVYAGTYREVVLINKSLTIRAVGDPVLEAPDTRNTYRFTESAAKFDPIIFAYGGTMSGDTVSGPGTIEATIDGFEINGRNKAVSARFVGVLYRNVKVGGISHCSIHHMYDADGQGNGPETFGILVYGDSNVTVEHNGARDFSRGGIGIQGDNGVQPDPIAAVKWNTVTGNGLEVSTDWWAENGIQMGYGAGGSIIENTVSQCIVNNPSWASIGILVRSAAQGVQIRGNSVADCDTCIAASCFSSPCLDVIEGNNVTGATWDAIRLGLDGLCDQCTVYNNTISDSWAGIGAWDSSGNKIEGNRITQNEYGIIIDGNSNNNNITRNDVLDNTADGILVEPYGGYDPSGTLVNYNNIAGNTIYGIEQTGANLVDADSNWWGDSTGPSHSSNLGGTGDAITANIDYTPWLGDPFEVIPRTYHVNPTGTIQEAITEANSGDTIFLHTGTYTEGPQFVIDKNLSLKGEEASTTIIRPSGDTGSSGDSRGWFLVNTGITFNIDELTFDGLGRKVYQAIRDKGQGIITNCVFKNIVYPTYYGVAVAVMGGNVDVINCTFQNIGRLGVIFFGSGVTGSLYSCNSYTGKGNGDWLDYAVEVGGGAHATIDGNTISGCTGIASVDGSTSAGILVTTYFGAGSQATITHNDISGCTTGAAIGYDEYDTSSVVAHENNLYNNEYGLTTTAPTVDATHNWWGDATGPYHPELNPSGKGNEVSDNVTFEPWLVEPYPPATEVEALLYIDPASVEYWTVSYGKTFTVDVRLDDVTNLYGYDFKLYWDTALLDLVGIQITPPWTAYYINTNVTQEDLGSYWLSVAGLNPAPPFSGNTTLAKLTFKITLDTIHPENKTCSLDLAETALSEAGGVPIYHMVHDGTYTIRSTKPTIRVEPSTYVAHALGEMFKINITVSDVVNLYNFSFKLSYNTTLLDATTLELGPFLNPPTYVNKIFIDDANGEIWLWVWSVDGALPASGSGVLATVTFKTTTGAIWTTKHSNILSCAMTLHDTLLVTNTGIEVAHNILSGTYYYQPKPGDLNMDGCVNLIDLRMLTYYYKPGYPQSSIADLNEDGYVDLYDLTILTPYYGEDC